MVHVHSEVHLSGPYFLLFADAFPGLNPARLVVSLVKTIRSQNETIIMGDIGGIL